MNFEIEPDDFLGFKKLIGPGVPSSRHRTDNQFERPVFSLDVSLQNHYKWSIDTQ